MTWGVNKTIKLKCTRVYSLHEEALHVHIYICTYVYVVAVLYVSSMDTYICTYACYSYIMQANVVASECAKNRHASELLEHLYVP
jgi:hypothetical protein